MNNWKISRRKCLKCGACVSVCPTMALKLDEKGIRWDKEKCTYCSNCQQICPVGAIEIIIGDDK